MGGRGRGEEGTGKRERPIDFGGKYRTLNLDPGTVSVGNGRRGCTFVGWTGGQYRRIGSRSRQMSSSLSPARDPEEEMAPAAMVPTPTLPSLWTSSERPQIRSVPRSAHEYGTLMVRVLNTSSLQRAPDMPKQVLALSRPAQVRHRPDYAMTSCFPFADTYRWSA